MDRYSERHLLPSELDRLGDLATDLRWSWSPEARQVFRKLDYSLWRATAHNPVRMLWSVPRATLESAAIDPGFLAVYDRAVAMLDEARTPPRTWWSTRLPHTNGQSIAYFSAE